LAIDADTAEVVARGNGISVNGLVMSARIDRPED
jgi:hypothetical protein